MSRLSVKSKHSEVFHVFFKLNINTPWKRASLWQGVALLFQNKAIFSKTAFFIHKILMFNNLGNILLKTWVSNSNNVMTTTITKQLFT